MNARILPAIILAAIVSGACGSKGDPLPPLRLVPAKTEGLAAVRLEGRPVQLTFIVPATNDDGSTPVDIQAMAVHSMTKPATDPAPDVREMLGEDHRVATIDVAQPQADAGVVTGDAPAAPQPPQPGATITWEDPAPAVYPTPHVRYYAVAGLSGRNRVGVASAVVAVPLTPLEGAPSELSASFTEAAIKLDWLGMAEGTSYRVYEVKEGAPDVAVTAQPVTATTYQVPLVPALVPAGAAAEGGVRAAFGVERCFTVRAARASAGASVESAAAQPVCVTPRDVFPPPAPANLTAVASEGALSLIWDAVDAADLAGYIVLRGAVSDATLTPLFDTPTSDTTYRDTTATPGQRYVYAVVAVDTASPANRSAESNRVEEIAR